jgi:hypothetical protein
MAKKHKKFFKQKIKEMLSQTEKVPASSLTKPETTTQISRKESETFKIEPKTISQPLTPVFSIGVVKSDLKKIALLFGVMLVVVILVAFITSKTSWFSILADKIYNIAQLGS